MHTLRQYAKRRLATLLAGVSAGKVMRGVFALLRTLSRPGYGHIALVSFLLFSPLTGTASQDGITGYSGNSAVGGGRYCSDCHSGGSVPSLTITGATSVTPGTSHQYLITLNVGTAPVGGFNVSTSAGTLSVADSASTRKDNASGEVTHTQLATPTDSLITWTVNWQAPNTEAAVIMYVAGLSGDNDGSFAGDGSVVETLNIDVTTVVVNLPPVALIDAPALGIEGVSVSFDASASSDSDGNIVQYHWEFGDGATDSAATPATTHAFDAGEYTVTLTVTDNEGEQATATANITINPGADIQAPLALPGTDYSGAAGTSLSFDGSGSVDADGSIARYLWDFGDGSAFGFGAVVDHTYTDVGDYTVTLAVTDNDGITGAAATTASIVPAIPPGADAGGPYSAAVSDILLFDGSASSDADGTIVEHLWDFGDGTLAFGVSPSHVYISEGVYTATLHITDNHGLKSTASAVVDISPLSSTPDGAALYNSLCSGCHGVAGAGGPNSAVTNATLVDITAAINVIPVMNSLDSLSVAGVQAIADYLSDGTGGGSGGSGSVGQTLYDDNCAGCHGPGGSGGAFVAVVNATATQINDAIVAFTAMNNIVLTSTEVQAIADYLSGNPGGGGSKPTTGEGLYNLYCQVCHGTNGSGGPDGSVTNESANAINSAISNKNEMQYLSDVLTGEDVNLIAGFLAGNTGGGSGNTGGGGTGTAGQTLYDANCAGCHGPGGSGGAFVAVNNATATQINDAIVAFTAMNNIALTSAEVQSIADYLSGSSGGGGTKPVTGEGLYNLYCQVCHGANGSGGPDGSVTNKSANAINNAISDKNEMQYLSDVLTGEDINLIAGFLSDSGSGGD